MIWIEHKIHKKFRVFIYIARIFSYLRYALLDNKLVELIEHSALLARFAHHRVRRADRVSALSARFVKNRPRRALRKP